MKAFNTELFDNTMLIDEAETLQSAGFIDKKQVDFIEAKLPAYHKHSNIFARIGLIILGGLLYSACCSFLSVASIPFMATSETGVFKVLVLLYAIIGFIALELIFIRQHKFYRHGLDDAFLYCAQASALTFIGLISSDADHFTGLFFAAIVLGILCCIRYVDSISALIACTGLCALTTDICFRGSAGKLLLPFAMMLVAVGIFVICRFLQKNNSVSHYYKKSIQLCLAFSAILFYFSGNYLVVRELSELLLDMRIMPGSDIAFAPFFYAFTFLTPAGFIYFSLVKHNRALLWIGILTFAFSIFTIRYYYHFMPAEVALLIGGLLLFGIAFFALSKLKERTTGVTAEPDRHGSSSDLLNLEAIWLIENYGAHAHPTSSNSLNTGGGEFGGAGSSDNF